MEVEMAWKHGRDPKEGRWPGRQIGVIDKSEPGVVIERDVPVEMRDGVRVYVDIFRPDGASGVPVILTWSPYGKHAFKTFDVFPNSGVPKGSVSKYAAWEGPDPLYWVGQGYSVINGDCRGSWGSEGDLEIQGPQEIRDAYDVIEWAARLPWCNGRVGMAGVSYLAIVQWRIAASQPPHLACINPWEGFSDIYRDYAYHGGIPETNFVKFMEWSCQFSLGKVEDWVAMLRAHPLLDAYWQTKSLPRETFAKILVPAYVVADWGDQGLHTRGTLEAFEQLGSEAKWLEVHGRKKWQYYYTAESVERQRLFYDRFLKLIENDVTSWPRVRLEVRDRAWRGEMRSENEWPIERTRAMPLFLDGEAASLTGTLAEKEAVVSYQADVTDSGVDFVYWFESTAELTGSMWLRLWVEPDVGADDMDIFVGLDKLDSSGMAVPFVTMAMLDDGPMALGWLRASHRELDSRLSTGLRPWHKHEVLWPVRHGEVVPVDIEIWPSSTRFRDGEGLRLRVQGNDILRYDLPQAQLHEESVNKGAHFIHCGGRFDSKLIVPLVPTVGAVESGT